MVTTRHSNAYTDYALSSLIRHTRFEPDDEVMLIDNDRVYGELPSECRGRVQVHANESPRSFAANVNQTMERARERKADIVFLNNDLIFSPDWYEPMRVTGNFLLSPVSNAELAYTVGDLQCKLGMDLEEYVGRENLFLEVVRQHQANAHGYRSVLKFGFFAVKIPHAVYSLVGPFDENFGVGGGEDTDYCIRCHLRGIELRYALNSYLLHFIGKSTWRGAETREQTIARDQVYRERFKQKWGRVLFALLIMDDVSGLSPELLQALHNCEFRRVIESLARRAPVSRGTS
jgi:GT2 family glycosyltransferase